MPRSLRLVGRESAAARIAATARTLSVLIDAGAAQLDPAFPRRNVHCVYGQSGIGKTAFVSGIGRWLEGDREMAEAWGPAPFAPGGWRVARADIESWTTVEGFLLRLRSCAAAADVPCRAFDLGLATRWAVTRAGESFPEAFVSSTTGGLRELVEEGAALALEQVGLGPARAAGEWLSRVSQLVARRARASNTVAECPYLGDALEELARSSEQESAVLLATLLTWDLSFVAAARRPGFAVILDTFEVAQTTGRYVEWLVNDLVWSTPSILWIIAGRERLDWAEVPTGTLLHTGAASWPSLNDDDTQALGLLSAAEVDLALDDAVTSSGRPITALRQEVRAAVARAAGGLPIYLDVAWRLAEPALRGAPLDAATFSHGFPGVVERLFGRMTEEDRHLLRAASIFETFDPSLLSAAGAVSVGAAERFVGRSLIEPSLNLHRPLRLHAAVRAAILAMPVNSHDAWASEDWQVAAMRALEALHDRHERRDVGAVEQDLDTIVAAFEVAARFQLSASWLIAAALQHQPRTEPVARVLVVRNAGSPGSWSHDFARLIGAWMLRGEDRLSDLRSVAADGTVADDVRRSAHRRLAYQLRTYSRHEEAAVTLNALRALPGGDTGLNKYQHALTLTHLGRFKDAERLAREIGDFDRPPAGHRLDRLRGEIHLHHGRVELARDAVMRRRQQFEKERSWKLVLEQKASEARLAGLLSSEIALADETITMTQEFAAFGDLRTALGAKALALAGDHDAVTKTLCQIESLSQEVGLRPVSMAAQLARAFDLIVRNESPEVSDGRPGSFDDLEDIDIRWRRPIAWWSAWVADRPSPSFASVQWQEPEEDVRERWISLVRMRRTALGIG